MRFATVIFPALVATMAMASPRHRGTKGGSGAGTAGTGTAGAGTSGAGTSGSGASGSGTLGSGTTGAGNSSSAQATGVGTAASGNTGGANNAGAQGQIAANGLPQLPNPDPTFDAANSNGDLRSFTPLSKPLAAATQTAVAGSVNAAVASAVQAAADNWSFDTGLVSNFQNIGKTTDSSTFGAQANIAYNAEVDELAHKAVLDSVFGNDPQVSIANQTLTNGVFQSVVNNLQIMALQGKDTQTLIDAINNVRCTQILPSIDTYLATAAKVIGSSATLRTAIRPSVCAGIVANADKSTFPGGLTIVDIRGNTDQVAPGATPPDNSDSEVIPSGTTATDSTTSGSSSSDSSASDLSTSDSSTTDLSTTDSATTDSSVSDSGTSAGTSAGAGTSSTTRQGRHGAHSGRHRQARAVPFTA